MANTVSGHGTLVTGSAVGDGSLSGGSYAGSAPGADLNFYKIGDDITGSAPEADIIEAISRALTVGSDIFSMSYVGVSIYMDGSGPTAQAIDAAHAAGMMCFFAAGNGRARDKHFSIDVAPNTNTGAIAYTIDNSTGRALTEPVRFRVIWIDGTPDANLTLALTNPGPGESLVHEFSGTSPRGTETRQYVLTPNLSNGVSKTYQLALRNTAVSGPAPLVHIFVREDDEPGTFDNPDPAFTVRWPAIADSAIAVGAWTHRTSWIDFNGSLRFVPLASRSAMPTRFSAFGPRIDGVMKPDIVAPGQGVITTRDRGTHITTLAPLAGDYARIIDDDGVNVDGSGPANYYVVSGTSLASSMAAGAAALLLEADNSLTPERVMQALCSTASNAVSPDNTMGFGVIDVFDAICTLDLCGPGFATFGTGCIAGADVPILDAASGYLPRLGETFTMEISNLPASALAYGVLGLSDSYFGSIPLPQDLSLFGFPDCVQYVSADYITPQLPQAGGVASWDVLIPNAISGLAGVQFFAQGVVLFGSGEGAVSNAASCVIGAR